MVMQTLLPQQLFGSGPAPFGVASAAPGTEQDLFNRATNVETAENANQQQQNNFLTDAFNRTQSTLLRGTPTDLLFSKAADTAGMRARGNLNSLRASLGARGIDPNSGAASGLLSRIMLQQQGDLMGAKRDISIEDAKSRQAGAAQNFANAMNLAQFRNTSPSMVGVDMATNLAEMRLAREGINAQSKSQRRASKDNLLGGIIGAGASILGGLI